MFLLIVDNVVLMNWQGLSHDLLFNHFVLLFILNMF